ncbi:copper homeostasis protein cutC homolog [Episyrphus balteatus]|uniref:copper homeostasis protein cutC homolog n=1 Tax=Episyrphus balteatus TaxID=286459 RepID=UPI00248534A9|nr:copper homeostasis protein cutC homolog [Episyrphus balteatus]
MLEVCVDSIASAIAAAEGGASRLELCSALSEGGLTPTVGTLKALKSLPINIPIFCMLRPRRGNDFMYSNAEMDALLYDVALFKSHGCDGFVFGALDERRCISEWQCKQVVQMAGKLPVTFHRAFDLTAPCQMHETVNQIKNLGFTRILTSGFKHSCVQGIYNIRDLVNQHDDIIIMPGAGISSNNLNEVLVETKCKEFHASARKKVDPPIITTTNISMGGGEADLEPLFVTDEEMVRELVAIAKHNKIV